MNAMYNDADVVLCGIIDVVGCFDTSFVEPKLHKYS